MIYLEIRRQPKEQGFQHQKIIYFPKPALLFLILKIPSTKVFGTWTLLEGYPVFRLLPQQGLGALCQCLHDTNSLVVAGGVLELSKELHSPHDKAATMNPATCKIDPQNPKPSTLNPKPKAGWPFDSKPKETNRR